jgi:YrbI family 3-deoxy-D-manno-octulosonate 8-phosphate phosphatase|tara:strand:+ start:33 stop:512 length:480 start_codon:yes stop_codon:yes gene_type:complete
MIRVLVFDIDGVLTDGRVSMDEDGREVKSLHYHDIDAIFEAHRQGFTLAFLTGEDTPLVSVIAKRVDIVHIYRKAKDKSEAMLKLSTDLNVSLKEIMYVGDSLRDADALAMVGLGLAPADADESARKAANKVLEHLGGAGAVNEAVRYVIKLNGKVQEE